MANLVWGRSLSPVQRLKFIGASFTAAAGLVGALGVKHVHDLNNEAYASAPTPSAFLTRQGFSLTSGTQAWLKEFDDIRIVPPDSPLKQKYCRLTEVACDGNYALIPSGWLKLAGMRTVIFLDTYSPDHNEKLIRSTTGMTAQHSEERSRIAYLYTVFHELSHPGSKKKIFGETYDDVAVVEKEAEADEEALPHLDAETGPKGREYAFNFRALTQAEPTHDVLPHIYVSFQNPRDAAFKNLFDNCAIAWPPASQREIPARLTALYDCLKTQPEAAPTNALAYRRDKYLAAYNYFFNAGGP